MWMDGQMDRGSKGGFARQVVRKAMGGCEGEEQRRMR